MIGSLLLQELGDRIRGQELVAWENLNPKGAVQLGITPEGFGRENNRIDVPPMPDSQTIAEEYNQLMV